MGFNWNAKALVEFCQPINIDVDAVSMKKLLIFLLEYKPGVLPNDPEALKPHTNASDVEIIDGKTYYDDYEEYLDLDVNEFTGEHRELVEKLNQEVGKFYEVFNCLGEAFKLFRKQLNKEVTQEFDRQMFRLPEDLVPVIKSYHQHEIMNFELKASEGGCDGIYNTSLRLVYKTYYPEGSGIDCGPSNIPMGVSLTEIDIMDTKKKETICKLMQFIMQKIGLKPCGPPDCATEQKPGWYLYTEASEG